MKKKIIKQLKLTKDASYSLPLLSQQTRNQILSELADQLILQCQKIIKENSKDLALMDKSDPRYDRLLLSRERIEDIAHDLNSVSSLDHTPGNVLEEKTMPNGLKIKKISVPLGVVAVVYESRPNVTIDVFSLCFKTGNACILKGGKEAHHTNKFLVSLIQDSLKKHEINSDILYLLPPDREILTQLLTATGLVDVCIPRGSQALIEFVRDHATIPVIETGSGIVHTYFDLSGSVEKGRAIIDNAKTRRVSVCNALDTLIIHKERLSDLPLLVELLANKNVELFADEESYQALKDSYPKTLLHKAKTKNFGQEYLSYKMSIKTVDGVEEAVQHITTYSSGHSEAIIAQDEQTIEYFLSHIDAAAVYVNTSTAFTDGAQFGMGAEIGISTQKLHARGPMALDALTSYKWVIFGDGQIRV